MDIESEKLPPVANASEADLARIFAMPFGAFIILTAEDGSFIQAADAWALDDQASGMWVLEYRDGPSGRQYAATKAVPLQRVHAAFLSYLRHNEQWLQLQPWKEIAA